MSEATAPNIVVLMADQLTPLSLRFYGGRTVRAPVMEQLAAEGVVFENAYCAMPLCAPARASLMSGRLASRIGVFDNAAEFASDIPTFAHALRRHGYQTILSGKMHFCGPDQMHGFEERLTTDIYPADFVWTPNWDRPDEPLSWYHTMNSVLDAGPCVRTNQLDFDDEVVFASLRKIYDLARTPTARPFLLTVSLTHPHDPFTIPEPYWSRHDDSAIDAPVVRHGPEVSDRHTLRLRAMYGADITPPSDAHVEAARRAYYGAISYVDEQFGRVRAALEVTGLARNTVVVLLSDHGEMLGERGLWYKMHFFEGAARIPLVVHAPDRFPPRRIKAAVSAVDVLPTLLELAGAPASWPAPIDGRSLVPHLRGEQGHDEAVAEYLAEGAIAPMVMIRRAAHKFICSPPDPDLLFDLEADPNELTNLADSPDHQALVEDLRADVTRRWDLPALHEAILASQRRRRLVHEALATGATKAWDFEPASNASKSYIRSHMALEEIEAAARFPRVGTK